MKYLQTFKESFAFERQPIMDLQEFLPDYNEIKYWKVTRNIHQEDIDKGIVKPEQTRITLYWKIEKNSDKEYKFISQNTNNNNKTSFHIIDNVIIEILLKINPEDDPKITPLTPEEIEEFEINLQANKFNL